MRRVIMVAAGLVVAGGAATIGASAAIGAGDPPASHSTSASARSAAQQIAASLADASARAKYHLPAGALVSATVCIHASCATKQFQAAPLCAPAPATCVGTATVSRRYAGGLTISVELA